MGKDRPFNSELMVVGYNQAAALTWASTFLAQVATSELYSLGGEMTNRMQIVR